MTPSQAHPRASYQIGSLEDTGILITGKPSSDTPSHIHNLPPCANHNLGVTDTVTPLHTDTLRCHWLGIHTNSRWFYKQSCCHRSHVLPQADVGTHTYTLTHSHILMDLSPSAEASERLHSSQGTAVVGYEEGNMGDEMWDHGEEDRHLGRSQTWQAHQISAMI